MPESTRETNQAAVSSPPITAKTILVPLVAWLIPGAGHIMQKRFGRGLLLMFSVVTMFLLGLAGDVGAGGLYFLTLALDAGKGAISHATADYGTKYLIVAGLLNFICVADAYHIAIGQKP